MREARPNFFTLFSERAQFVHEAVLAELENRRLRGHEQRCLLHLGEAVYNLSENSPDLFHSSICQRLLDQLHHRNARVRFRALAVFDQLANRAGDALTPVLPLVVQHLTETLEGESACSHCSPACRLGPEGGGAVRPHHPHAQASFRRRDFALLTCFVIVELNKLLFVVGHSGKVLSGTMKFSTFSCPRP